MDRKRKAFTLLELLIAVTVLSIIAALSVVGYQGYRDRAAMLQDETNQEMLQIALKMYVTDTGTVAGSISELRPLDMERAYAAVTEEKKPYTFLVFLEEKIVGIDTAEALTPAQRGLGLGRLPSRYYSNNLKTLICPSDPTPPASLSDTENRSYEIAPSAVEGMRQAVKGPLSWLLDPAHAGSDLIIESDDGENTAYRHGRDRRALAVVTKVNDKKNRRDINPQFNSSPPPGSPTTDPGVDSGGENTGEDGGGLQRR